MDLSERPSHPFRRHPWERARFGFFRALLRDAGLDQQPSAVLDAGAGDGWFAAQLLAELRPGTALTCWHASDTPNDVCPLASTSEPHIRFTAERPAGRFDLLLLLDVLEHVERDREFLGELVADNLATDATGYFDADLSTPIEEIPRLLAGMDRRDAAVVMDAPVALLGTTIQRRPHRHYLGRVFATAASLILRVPVYDTQCGAKFFRDTPALRGALATPFISRWTFDVLTGRLLLGAGGTPPLHPEDFVEVPLQGWTDVSRSRLRAAQMLRAAYDLLLTAVELRALRRGSRR